MNEFLTFFDNKKQYFPMHLEITYSKVTDYTILIYKKGCASDFPESDCEGNDVNILCVQDCDIELCFAKAHVALKEWFLKYNGGY